MQALAKKKQSLRAPNKRATGFSWFFYRDAWGLVQFSSRRPSAFARSVPLLYVVDRGDPVRSSGAQRARRVSGAVLGTGAPRDGFCRRHEHLRWCIC